MFPQTLNTLAMRCSFRPLVVACIILFFFQITNATKPESYLLFSITSQNTARLGIVNTSKRFLELEIADDNGETIYSKKVLGKQNYFQLLSLANMPDGEYRVTLKNIDKIEEKKFIIKNSDAQLFTEQPETEPSFYMQDDNSLIISYLNSKEALVNIFFIKDDDVVFEDRGLTGRAMSKKYSLKQLPRGEYTVKLYAGSKIYTYPLVTN